MKKTVDIVSKINETTNSNIAVMGKDIGKQKIESFPTGILPLDFILGIGGFPKGRITEIHGLYSSGKSSLCLSYIANNQNNGAKCAWIDAEHSFDFEHAKRLGVYTDDLLLIQPDYGEQAVDAIEELIKGGTNIIIIDSVSGIVPRAEIEGDAEKAPMASQARLIAKLLRKVVSPVKKKNISIVFINQLRQNIMGGQFDPYVAGGGLALQHYSSIRLEIKKLNNLQNPTTKDFNGFNVQFRTKKNKCWFPAKTCTTRYFFETGFEKEGDMIEMGIESNVITREGNSYFFNKEKIGSGKENCIDIINTRPELKMSILSLIFPQTPQQENIE
jgi:recombination protein RecA